MNPKVAALSVLNGRFGVLGNPDQIEDAGLIPTGFVQQAVTQFSSSGQTSRKRHVLVDLHAGTAEQSTLDPSRRAPDREGSPGPTADATAIR